MTLDLRDRKHGEHRAAPLWAVCVQEKKPRSGEKPLEWLLLTTYAVEDFESCEHVVSGYTYRWRIEEFHQTWKSAGTDVESTQLRAADGSPLRLLLAPGSSQDLPGGGRIRLDGVARYAAVDVRHDPGKGIALASSSLALAGLVASLMLRRRRIWVRVTAQADTLGLEISGLARGSDPGLDAHVAALVNRMLPDDASGSFLDKMRDNQQQMFAEMTAYFDPVPVRRVDARGFSRMHRPPADEERDLRLLPGHRHQRLFQAGALRAPREVPQHRFIDGLRKARDQRQHGQVM